MNIQLPMAFGLAFFMVAASPQNVIENSDKAANPAAGRILELEEVVRLSDESGKFFFKYPRFVRTGPDGSMVILDVDQLLRFNAEGRFLQNLFRKGQGPGEMNYVSNVAFDREALVVHSSSPEKLIWLDKDGQLIRDVSLVKLGNRGEFLFFDQGSFYFLQLKWPADNDRMGLGSREGEVLAVSPDGLSVKKVAAFANRYLRYGGAIMWDGILAVPLNGRFLAVSSTPEYGLGIYDCLESRLLRSFKRKYKRVASSAKNRGAVISSDGTRHELPGSEWNDDIAALYAVGDRIWARTSTVDERKGVLIDVFDLDGRYVDAFYVKSSGRLLDVQGDILFFRETSPDELIEIAGYRVVANSKRAGSDK